MEKQVQLQYDLLMHSGLGSTEIRVPKLGKQHFCKSVDEIVKHAIYYQENEKADVYIGINPRASDVGTIEAVSHVTCIVLDIDPIRPKDTPSTDEAHLGALDIATAIKWDFPFASVVDSGSGAHVYFPVVPHKLTDKKLTTETISKWFRKMREKYSREGYNFDSIHDLPRIIRLWGSHNFKSNRPCYSVKTALAERARLTDLIGPIQASSPILVSKGTRTEERFNRLLKTNETLARIVNEDLSFPSRSESDYAFIMQLAKAGFRTSEIEELALFNPTGRKDEIRRSDIERVVEKARESGGSRYVSPGSNSEAYFMGLSNRRAGVCCGISPLDATLGGLRPNNVYLLAARPSQGKTSLSTQFGLSLAKQDLTVQMFPTETKAEPIFDKMLASMAEVPLLHFRDGTFSEEDKSKIAKAKADFSKLPIQVVENFSLTAEDLLKTAKDTQPDVVILDYIQAMAYSEGGTPSEMAQVMRACHEIAGNYNCIVLLLSQLSRGAEFGEVGLSHLKGSGSLEEMADVVMAMWTLDKFAFPRPVEIGVLKNRYGPTDKHRLLFDTRYGRFAADSGTVS